VELSDELRSVDDQERGTAQIHRQRPVQSVWGPNQGRCRGLDAGKAVL